MAVETPVERFQRLMLENNLTFKLSSFPIKSVDDGSLIISTPSLIIEFADLTQETKEENDGTK